MESVHKPLLIAGLMLVLVSLSCIASSAGQSSEAEDAVAKYQACLDNFADRGFAGVSYLDCLQPLSISELEAIREHDICLAIPECLVAVQTALDTHRELAPQTEAGPCAGLTPEECANAGRHGYEGTVTANLELCGIPSIKPLEYWAFSFAEGQVQFERFSATSFQGYVGHTRVAANTYEFIYPDGLTTNRLTFTQNGFVEESIFEAGCELTHTYALSE